VASFTILTVCTGNVCRSPIAEQLLRLELRDLPGVRVHSAGTNALVSAPMTPEAKEIAEGLGVARPEAHIARQLRDVDIREADLVLASARDHRRVVVEFVPRAARKTFTVREFARLANAVEDGVFEANVPLLTESVAERMNAGVELISSMRGSLPPLESPLDDDVDDPYRQSADVYASATAQLIPAVRSTAELLRRATLGSL